MLFHILNKDQETIGTLTTGQGGTPIYKDMLSELLEAGASTFKFFVPLNSPESKLLTTGNLIFFEHNGEDFLHRIVRGYTVVSNKPYVEVRAESVGIELLNSVMRPYDGGVQDVEVHLANVLNITGWEIGLIEVEGSKEFIKKKPENRLRLIHELADLYEAEVEFKTFMKGTRVDKKVVNFYKERGEDLGVRLEYSKDTDEIRMIETLVKDDDFNGIVSKIIAYGKEDDDGNPITFTDVVWSKSSGDPMDKPAGQDYLEDEEATELWSLNGNPIEAAMFFDTNNPEQLITEAYNYLIKNNSPRTYLEVSTFLLENIPGYEHEEKNIGDKVWVINHKHEKPIQERARIIEKHTSFSNPSDSYVVVGQLYGKPKTLNRKFKELEEELKAKKPVSGVDEQQVLDIIKRYPSSIPGFQVSPNVYEFDNSITQNGRNLAVEWYNTNLGFHSGLYPSTNNQNNNYAKWRNITEGDVTKTVLSFEQYNWDGGSYDTEMSTSINLKFNMGKFYLLKFKYRRIGYGKYIRIEFIESGYAYNPEGEKTFLLPYATICGFPNLPNVRDVINEDTSPHDWREASIVITPLWSAIDKGFSGGAKGSQLNSIQFSNTNMYDVTGDDFYSKAYSNEPLLYSKESASRFEKTSIDIEFRLEKIVDGRPPLAPVDKGLSVHQFCDFELYELSTDPVANSVGYDSTGDMYLQPQGGKVRVTQKGVPNPSLNHVTMVAGEFSVQSSQFTKQNVVNLIEKYGEQGLLNLLMELKTYSYHRNADIDNLVFNKEKFGMLLEEVPDILKGDEGIDINTVLNLQLTVQQIVIQRLANLEKELNNVRDIVMVLAENPGEG